MSIYTKTGDKGTTALVGGSRVSKTDLQVEAYGCIDELNSTISLAQKSVQDKQSYALLEAIQYQLFFMGAELATPADGTLKANQQRVNENNIKAMEDEIDRCMSTLPPVTSFVLPGSSEAGSRIHVARTIVRRAERLVVRLAETKNIRFEVLQYLNRLSDCLYALARNEDHLASTNKIIEEIKSRYLAAMQSSNTSSTEEKATESRASTTLNIKNTSTQMALEMLQRAIAKAEEIHVPIVFALVDRHGNTILSYRMPEALLVSSDLAVKKAYTSVAMKAATHEISAAVQPGSDLYQIETSSNGRIVTFGGGFPIIQNKKVIGGVGISGGSVEEDMLIAQAALGN